MIGVVVPAHNEEDFLAPCLESLLCAARHPALLGEEVRIVAVLDDCSDGSRALAARYPVAAIDIAARNVGLARCAGARVLLAAGTRWLAFTDADTLVSDTWLVDQLALGADAVCGCVTVDDWTGHSPAARARYESQYLHSDGHRHVHGANFGVSAAAYRQAGGFAGLALSEDVALVRALIAAGVDVAWSARPRVRTSARHISRLTGGFASFLVSLAGDGDLAA